jgi:16S rRNA (guanine527-N7)-methyltransferase
VSDPAERFFSPALAGAIVARAAACGVELPDEAVDSLVLHIRRVRERNEELHLTSIDDADEYVERHLGEGFEGAAMLPRDVAGPMLDLGSGNGYPGLPVAAARPGLRPLLAEASPAKAAFLRSVVEEAFPGGTVLDRQVQRPADLRDAPLFRVIVTRAAGGWERILPRLAPCLEPDGRLLVWAGESMHAVSGRTAWRRYRLEEKRPLPERERSWIWRFGRA